EGGTTEELSKVDFTATGGCQAWKTFAGKYLFLEKGLHTVRIYGVTASFNFNWFELTFLSEEEPIEEEALGVKDTGKKLFEVYPNPTVGSFKIRFSDTRIPEMLFKHDLAGKTLLSVPTGNAAEIVIDHH